MNSEAIVDRSDAVCIVGAGPGGVVMARALRRQGIDYDQFERHSDVGGLWDIANPGSPMYHSAHFISSRALSGFTNFPMPEHWPDYPSHRQITAYIRSFVDSFDLRRSITFNCSVTNVEQEADGRWLVTTSDGKFARYWAVICGSGHTWDPRLPEVVGHFSGEMRHTVTYKHASELDGKRVLIVGAGNSGADISDDAATHASRAVLSMRRGYHIIPKHVFGMPADAFAARKPKPPMWLARPVMSALLKLIWGDLQKYGLPKPDHKLFESHTLLNSQIVPHLQHGRLSIKPAIKRYDGNTVHFVDGSSEDFDLVLFATGYLWRCDYAKAYMEEAGNERPDLYLSLVSRKFRNIFALGIIEANSGSFGRFDHEALMIARYLQDQRKRPAKAAEFDALIQSDYPDLSGGMKFVDSPRHHRHVEYGAFRSYADKIARRMGWRELSDPNYFEGLKRNDHRLAA